MPTHATLQDFTSNMLSKDNVISFASDIVIDTGDNERMVAQQQGRDRPRVESRQQLVSQAIANFKNVREEREWNSC